MKTCLLFLVLTVYAVGAAQYNVDELRCLVCNKSLDELNRALKKIDPSKKVDIGGYRLDPQGNMNRKTVSQSKSEIHLGDIIEKICNKMDDYIRAKWKSNGRLTLLKLIEDGRMNTAMSEVDAVTDDDLNKSLKYYCEGIMEEFEEQIIKHIQEDEQDLRTKVCVEDTTLCRDFLKESKPEDEPLDDENYVESNKEEL